METRLREAVAVVGSCSSRVSCRCDRSSTNRACRRSWCRDARARAGRPCTGDDVGPAVAVAILFDAQPLAAGGIEDHGAIRRAVAVVVELLASGAAPARDRSSDRAGRRRRRQHAVGRAGGGCARGRRRDRDGDGRRGRHRCGARARPASGATRAEPPRSAPARRRSTAAAARAPRSLPRRWPRADGGAACAPLLLERVFPPRCSSLALERGELLLLVRCLRIGLCDLRLRARSRGSSGTSSLGLTRSASLPAPAAISLNGKSRTAKGAEMAFTTGCAWVFVVFWPSSTTPPPAIEV